LLVPGYTKNKVVYNNADDFRLERYMFVKKLRESERERERESCIIAVGKIRNC